MSIKLQQIILQNVVNSTFSEEKSSIVHFSRMDRPEISTIKNLFDLDIIVRGIKPSEAQKRWSDMINSSQLDATFEAQAQYVNLYMKDLFPDLQKKVTRKP
jgi:hypothetical protein